MNIKLFRHICKGASVLLKGLAILMAVGVLCFLYSYFFTDAIVWFPLKTPSFPIVHSGRNFPTEAQQQLAALIEVPLAST